MIKALKYLALTFSLVATSWLAGFGIYLNNVYYGYNARDVQTQAIVALTGGKGRILTAMNLFEADKAGYLFISGVGSSTKLEELVEVNDSNRDFIEKNKDRIILGRTATNTAENASETAEWLWDNNITSIKLVTSNYHMPRSLLEFRNILGNTIDIIPISVINEKDNSNYGFHGIKLLAFEYSKYIIKSTIYFLGNYGISLDGI